MGARKFTMVMRCGDPKADANNHLYTLIGDDYSFKRATGSELAKAIQSKQVEVTNMEVGPKGLTTNNGAMKNYTLIDLTGSVVGVAKAVILDRIETDKGLVGYSIFNTNGTLQEVTVAQAVELEKADLIANGKIRHTSQGDIVSSINGLYPLRKLAINEAANDKTIAVDLLFMGSAIAGKNSVKYGGIIVSGSNAAAISKYYSTLVEANKKIISKVGAMSSDPKIPDTLGIKRTGSAGFYGVYPLDTIFDIIEKSTKSLTLPMSTLTIACTDYDDGGSEANITVDAKLKRTAYQEGSERSNKALKEYASKVVAKLSAYEIK